MMTEPLTQFMKTISTQKETQTIQLLKGSKSVDLSSFANSLTNAIQSYSSVKKITSKKTSILIDITTTPDSETSLERFVTITVVKSEDTDYVLTTNTITQQSSRDILVILHDQHQAPQNTKTLLKYFEPQEYYHTGIGMDKDFRRLARFLTNNAVGLVLSGGGARGFAHIGVFEALRESGVEIDTIGGTSIGAIIAAAIASGMEGETLRNNAFNAFVVDKPLKDYTLPIISFMKGKKLEKILQKYFAQQDIEDLKLPFFCVSTDMSLQQEKIHKTGQVWQALRASISIPGVLPPVVDGDSLLVDGGVINNLPVDIMQNKRVKQIIAVDLNDAKKYKLNYEKMPSWSSIFLNKFKPKGKKQRAPKLFAIMSTATVIASYHQAKLKHQLADFCLLPPVGKFSFLNFNNFDALVTTGYEYAKQHLKQFA